MKIASLPAERILLLAGLAALALVAGALGFQYLDHLRPCEMCHWQRWPHIAAALLALLAAPLLRKGAELPAMLIVAVAATLGLIAAFFWKMLGEWHAQVLAAVLVAILIAALWKKDGRALAMAVIALLAISGLIGAYQAGMQMGWLPAPPACAVDHPYILGSNDIPEVSCNAVTWSLFGLSLAAYNAIFSFLVAGCAALLLAKPK